MSSLIEFATGHPVLVGVFILLLLFLIWSLLDGARYGDYTYTPQQIVRLMNDENALLLDLRLRPEYDKGHLPQAVHAGMDDPAKDAKVSRDKKRWVILYGERDIVIRCLKLLRASGFQKVGFLRGGVLAWQDAGLPLIQDQ